MQLELMWGRLRRRYLKAFRPGYVQRMRQLRLCEPQGCPHEVLDPRDLKFYRNQTGDCWRREDDPFTWRDRLPFARVGLAELLLMSTACFGLAAILAFFFWPLALVPLVCGVLIVAFFRDPKRTVPSDPGVVVAPADGKIVEITELEADEYLGGPTVRIGIFLSIFNVHLNRAPFPAKVVQVVYRPGKMLNALRPESARENEQLELRLLGCEGSERPMIVRQITGAIARRIVCCARPGDLLGRGERFGMIKLGSRTELLLPREAGLELAVQLGQKVRAGSSIVARYGG